MSYYLIFLNIFVILVLLFIKTISMGKIFRTMLLALALSTVSIYSANGQLFKARYKYDANGNREKANIIYLKSNVPSPSPMIEDVVKLEESTEFKVSIFPNPTQGDLKVEITGGLSNLFTNKNNCIKVWDIKGDLIITQTPICSSNLIDLSKERNGTYIMKLIIGKTIKDYKIIKQ